MLRPSLGGASSDSVSAQTRVGERMDVRLDDRVAVITGASTGLGLAMATEFAASGGSVALLARREDALAAAKAQVVEAAQQTSAKVEAYSLRRLEGPADNRDLEKIMADFGKVDIVVNNAGISHAKAFDTVTDEDWQGDLDLKLFAAIRLCRLALPGMRERKWGRVVNVLNIGAKAPSTNSTPTSVSRAAGLALTKALSQENAPHNVLVNAMLVGLIESDQWRRRHEAANDGTTYQQFLDGHGRRATSRIGRMGKAEEFARMACFLCSDAGSFITGVAINVDGGASPVVQGQRWSGLQRLPCLTWVNWSVAAVGLGLAGLDPAGALIAVAALAAGARDRSVMAYGVVAIHRDCAAGYRPFARDRD